LNHFSSLKEIPYDSDFRLDALAVSRHVTMAEQAASGVGEERRLTAL